MPRKRPPTAMHFDRFREEKDGLSCTRSGRFGAAEECGQTAVALQLDGNMASVWVWVAGGQLWAGQG
eukprot:360508-Chlamydomonas_euryale.AAC.9